MSDHHDNNHSTEKKPIAFTTPFLLACVVLIAILSLVSLGNPCKCCDEECCGDEQTECKQEAGAKEDGGDKGAEKAAEPAKEEAHH